MSTYIPTVGIVYYLLPSFVGNEIIAQRTVSMVYDKAQDT